MASSLFFSAYEKLLPLSSSLSRAGIPHRIFVSRCRPTTALQARRGAAPTMAAILSTAMSVTVAVASLVCPMAPRGETSWPPVTAPVLVPDAPIASIVIAHAEDVYALRSRDRLKRSCPRNSHTCTPYVCTVAEYVEESSMYLCVCGPSCSPRTFVLIKGTSKLKVMICRNILVLALLSRCPTREMEPLWCLMPHLLAVRNPACSCGACLQCSIYIKRKDILSSLTYNGTER